jgi:IMP dehydrogenase
MSKNKYLDDFMSTFRHEGVTFDDVTLITQYADFLPNQTDVTSRFSSRISLNIPFVSAAMDTVTEARMAIVMAMLGGIGVVHRNLTPQQQAEIVSTVKHHLNGLITHPVTFRKTDTVATVQETRQGKGYSFSGFPILDENDNVVGILTAADIKFAAKADAPIAEVMTRDVITAPRETSLQQAYDIMQRNKIGKLPLVENGKLVGLYSFSAVRTLIH